MELLITKDTATPLLKRLQRNMMVATRAKLKVGATATYAKYVEYGTRKMGPRPFLRPAVEANRTELMQAFRDAMLFGNVTTALEAVGASIESLGKVLAPVRTGYLRSTIYHRVES